MQDQSERNPQLRGAHGSQWLRRLVLAGPNMMYGLALALTRMILGSTGFRELMKTLELP